MTADFSKNPDHKKRWIYAGTAALLVIVLIIPLAVLKSWQKIYHQPYQGEKLSSLFVGRET